MADRWPPVEAIAEGLRRSSLYTEQLYGVSTRRVWHFHDTETEVRNHSHVLRGDGRHHHKRNNGKTYFKGELRRADGMPVKCEGHPTVEFDVTDDWAYL